ncbi:protein translocase subunit SecDF [Catalinimonas niigatensis]|uniref:protein translocase subunit SecDF n=1 Tax=Catalinimonas niigatensis TaxID=1397264 RepID=UPI002666CA33|nr:protein translocase subunit SecDF [Catalinimonas niigatensis]WPP51928.1 protein translocase subunit SecDF [Catalinimonas niigatensis]
MRNKNVVVILTIIVSLICLYSLSFTFISRNVQQRATAYATTSEGEVDQAKKQQYLDSIWEKPVYKLVGYPYTFQDVKEKELNLGLDLQGGMHIIMEISPIEVLKALSNNEQSQAFQQALKEAEKLQKIDNESFVDLFYKQYQKLAPESPLHTIFANSRNQEYIDGESSDADVLAFIQQEVNDAVDRSFEIVRNRIDKFGVTQPNVQRLPGTERIQLELPGVDNPERVRKLLQGIAQLEFRQVIELEEMLPYWEQASHYWTTQHTEQKPFPLISADSIDLEQQLLQDTTSSALDFPIFGLSASTYRLAYQIADTATISTTLKELKAARVLPNDVAFLWDVKPENESEILELYVVRSGRSISGMLGGDVITNATQNLENGKPSVAMQMNTEGSRKWKKMTSENIGHRIAIVLDDQVYSAPVVQTEIPNGNSSISGNFTIEEAQDLANILKAGKMPAPIQIIEEAVVGPTLGIETITQGLVSMAAGLGLVVMFMVLYYSSGGMVANIALLFNIFFIIGVLAQLSASLTLPGIAGIVLTIGMSVDANVLIFERVKEELGNGKSVLNAIKLGYDKAYSSIIDSNATTFLTGVILYTFGSGGIKGFAVVLMIGIVSSLFTAVFISRLMIESLAKRGKVLSFTTLFSKSLFKDVSFNFIQKRKWAYRLSVLTVIVGLACITLQGGLNLGVDFKGGRSYVVRFDTPVAASDVRIVMLSDFQGAGLEVKTFNQDNQLKITTSYLAEDHSEKADLQVKEALEKGLQNYNIEHPEIISSAKIGATMAQDVKEAAQSSVIYTLGIIFLYILVRFQKWQYGLGAVVALAHDVLMVFAAYAIARAFGFVLEIDQVFIAAILTIIGYSINDTVVVFDRIREFTQQKTDGLELMYNKAINDTLSRTIITSFTVFVVVVVLLVFGGEVLRGFSFALLVGVILGTYSSIFIAAPLALDVTGWRNRKIDKVGNRQLSKA